MSTTNASLVIGFEVSYEDFWNQGRPTNLLQDLASRHGVAPEEILKPDEDGVLYPDTIASQFVGGFQIHCVDPIDTSEYRKTPRTTVLGTHALHIRGINLVRHRPYRPPHTFDDPSENTLQGIGLGDLQGLFASLEDVKSNLGIFTDVKAYLTSTSAHLEI